MHSIPSGESPPPPPRACFGRDDLIEKVIGLAESLNPLALIGPGGIGKTSIALTVLHHDRIKKRFGDNRRFIRCDQFPASRAHFLNKLSKAIDAGVKNPEDLTPLRSFLSSKEMVIILDNAESILDPQGTNSQEILGVVEELGRFSNIWLCITSRISTVPPDCKCLDVPTLSMDAACLTFYRIYDSDEQSGIVNDILDQLDFHPLSITLLATVARHSRWDTDRLAREWERQRTGVLRGGLAAAIELSLASAMFLELGPDARNLLEVVAFFPQGVDENNLSWLFPNISDRTHIVDTFCILSLAYRSNGFVTMLAPLRDHLRPKVPMSSQLLCATKDIYFRRLSIDLYPDKPGYDEARWIISEDVNVEHLLDVFTSVEANLVDVWDACHKFMEHLYYHKRRLVILGPKIERLPDDHPSKPECLLQLSWLFTSVGNYAEYKRLLVHALELWRERGDELLVARALRYTFDANRLLGLHKEGASQVEESLEICERLNDIPGQGRSLYYLTWSLLHDEQVDAAEEAASRAIELLSGSGEQYRVCQCHRVLGDIYHSKGETEKAIGHLETSLGIASSFNWRALVFWGLCSLAQVFSDQGMFDDAHTHVERAKLHTTNDPFNLGRATELQAQFWYRQGRFEESKAEALHAIEAYEKVGAPQNVEECRGMIRSIEERAETPETSGELDFRGEFPEVMLPPTPGNPPFSAGYLLKNFFTYIPPRTTGPASGRILDS